MVSLFALDASTISRLNLVEAARLEGQEPAGLLPGGVVDQVLQNRSEEVAALISAQLSKGFFVHDSEVMLASKVRGRRPVPVLSAWERVVYRALVQHLGELLPVASRSREVYNEFKNAPLSASNNNYVVMADIAACYQYVDHGLLESELVAQTGEGEISSAICRLLDSIMKHQFGLPQNRRTSDILAETVLSLVDRRVRRKSIDTWRYSDDYRMVARSRRGAHVALETLDSELRAIGLVLNEEKTSIRSRDAYEDWAHGVERRIAQVENDLAFDFQDFLTFGSDYDEAWDADDDEDDDDAQDDDVMPVQTAKAVLGRWSETLGDGANRARFGPDAVVDKTLLAATLRVLGRSRSGAALDQCHAILDTDPSLTPNVSRYLSRLMRHQESEVDGFLAQLLAAPEGYLSPWQCVWLMEPLRRSHGLTTEQREWLRAMLRSPLTMVRASAGDVLAARQGIRPDTLLKTFDETSVGARPKLVSAIARASGNLRSPEVASVTEGRPFYRWVAEAALSD